MSNSDFVTDFDAFGSPVLVAGAVSVKKRILMGLFRCFVLFLLYLWYQNGFFIDEGIIPIFLFVGVPYICCEMFLLALFLSRRWLLMTDDGFVYSSLWGSETVRLNDIDGYSISIKEHPLFIFRFGRTRTKTKRRFRLWVQGRKRPICLNHTRRSEVHDPLFGNIKFLINVLNKRFVAVVEDGGTVTGNNWTLVGSGTSDLKLYYETKTGTETLAVRDIGSVETLGERVHIWRKETQEACFSIPEDDKNVFFLAQFLEGGIGYIGQEESPVEGRGRFLFEKKRVSGWFYLAIGASILAAMIYGAVTLPTANAEQQTVTVILEIVGGLALTVLLTLWFCARGIRFYENGLTLHYPLFEREILFNEIEDYEWAKEYIYRLGIYDGTSVRFILYLDKETGMKKLDLSRRNVKSAEGAYETFCDKLSRYLAHRK